MTGHRLEWTSGRKEHGQMGQSPEGRLDNGQKGQWGEGYRLSVYKMNGRKDKSLVIYLLT